MRPQRRMSLWEWVLLVLLLGVFGVQALLASPQKSASFDEQYHLTAGYAYLRTGDFRLATTHDVIVTVEENVIMGGAGSAVLECLEAHRRTTPVLQLGLPDRFIDQGDPGIQLAECGLNPEGIINAIRARLGE